MAAALLCVAAAVGGCGGGVNTRRNTARQIAAKAVGGGRPLTQEEKFLSRRIVSPASADKYPAGSVQRAFVNFWSQMSYNAWGPAVGAFEPGLVKLVGSDLLVDALRTIQTQSHPVRPLIRGVEHSGNQATVFYFIRISTGALLPTSTSFARHGTQWQIYYMASLDDALGLAAQQRAQARINAASTTPAGPAIAAGAAARRLQPTYLEMRGPTTSSP